MQVDSDVHSRRLDDEIFKLVGHNWLTPVQ